MSEIIKAKDKRIIILAGIMGAGKTTVGMRLSKKLGINFIDSDKEIEKKCSKSPSKIFKDHGEEYFREIEANLIQEIISKNQPTILSLGGGALINENTRKLVKKECVSIWLYADIDTILSRVEGKTNRPLLNNVDKREVLSKLMKEREPLYKECDLKVESTAGNHNTTINNIIEELQKLI